nr:PucR family transcriptional regulator [Streptomyces antimycoticus]
MQPTVRDLLQLPHLRLDLRGGSQGVGRQVTWAQASDLDTPWDWMTGGELLMKNGRTLATDAAGQIALLTGLAENGASGLVIGLDPETPPLDAATLATADELDLPIVFAPYSVGFAAISRAVVDATTVDESRRLVLTERVYSMIRQAVTEPQHPARLTRLSHELQCRLAVLDAHTGEPALEGVKPVPGALRSALLSEIESRKGALPGVVHLTVDGKRAQLVEVPDEEPTVLLAYAFRTTPPDLVLLHHIATAAAVLLAVQGTRFEQQRRTGGELFSHLLSGRLLEEGDAEAQLTERRLPPEQCVVAAARGGSESGEQHLHITLARRNIPNLLMRRSGLLYALIPDTDEALTALQRRLGAGAAIGVSNPLATPARAVQALHEANWAVRTAETSSQRIARYAEATLLSILRDTEEARAIADRVLGPLLRYDEEHRTDLTKTLDVFLQCDRSWEKTAAAVGIHRQTVVYRMRRIENITGRNVTKTAHLAELWLALRARQLVTAPTTA